MKIIRCDGDCGNPISVWKVIMNKVYRKNYKQKKMYFCGECIQDLLGGTWSGGGPNGGDVDKIIKIKRIYQYPKDEYCNNCKYGQGIDYGWKGNIHCKICNNKNDKTSGWKKAEFIGWPAK